jgi:formylglycine-generating enzyme required for sulfatase activity
MPNGSIAGSMIPTAPADSPADSPRHPTPDSLESQVVSKSTPSAMSPFLRILAVGLALAASAVAQLQPLVSNVQASQRAGTKLVDISYNIAYGGGPVTIWIEVSNDGRRSFIAPAKTSSGHIGQNVQPGNNRAVVWNAEADFDGMLAEQMRVRVNARAGNVPVPPQHMVYIPGGHFYMGEWDSGNTASSRSVYVSPLFMDRHEVRGMFYREVREWGISKGYAITEGTSIQGNHPIYGVNWHDAVRWCNAHSEREGLTQLTIQMRAILQLIRVAAWISRTQW